MCVCVCVCCVCVCERERERERERETGVGWGWVLGAWYKFFWKLRIHGMHTFDKWCPGVLPRKIFEILACCISHLTKYCTLTKLCQFLSDSEAKGSNFSAFKRGSLVKTELFCMFLSDHRMSQIFYFKQLLQAVLVWQKTSHMAVTGGESFFLHLILFIFFILFYLFFFVFFTVFDVFALIKMNNFQLHVQVTKRENFQIKKHLIFFIFTAQQHRYVAPH